MHARWIEKTVAFVANGTGIDVAGKWINGIAKCVWSQALRLGCKVVDHLFFLPFFEWESERSLHAREFLAGTLPILRSIYVLIALALGEYGAIDRSADPKGEL